MSWVIDGNNLLGRAGASRDAADSKRQLIRSLANFARAKRRRWLATSTVASQKTSAVTSAASA